MFPCFSIITSFFIYYLFPSFSLLLPILFSLQCFFSYHTFLPHSYLIFSSSFFFSFAISPLVSLICPLFYLSFLSSLLFSLSNSAFHPIFPLSFPFHSILSPLLTSVLFFALPVVLLFTSFRSLPSIRVFVCLSGLLINNRIVHKQQIVI